MISRRSLLQAGASVGGAAVSGSAAMQPAVDRPNVLLILTDQQTYDAMSCAGNPRLKTPAMDSLAARGTRFPATYCAYPVCSPSRGSIFTGRMPHASGVRSNGQSIREGVASMGELFRDAGYETVYGGKWHLPKPFEGMTGFTRLIGGSGFGAKMDQPLADAAEKWLRNAPRQPFLMVASFMNPHDICEWIRQHPGSRQHQDPDRYPPAPANMAADPDEPEAMQFHRRAGYDLMSQAVGIASSWRRDDMRLYLHDYYRMVEAVDRCIGQILAALRDSSLKENTIVAFASDHGEGMGAHRWAQKASFYEESSRVPLIVAGPGVWAGQTDHTSLVSLTDLLPTFCDYAKVPVPDGVTGVSLRPALEGKPLTRTFVAGELLYQDQSREGRMIRTARHKYVVFNNGERPEQLFDLDLDPGEILNLAPRPEARAELDSHRAILRAWIRQTKDDFQMPV